MRKYYLFGKETEDAKIIQKIHEKTEKCWWHSSSDELEKDFVGYFNEKGECYDNCSSLCKKSWKIYENMKKQNLENFSDFQERIEKSLKEINLFMNISDIIQNLDSCINSKQKDINNGYVFADTRIGGSKKTRRFKKDNRRFLTDKETLKLQNDIEGMKREKHEACKKLKLEETLKNIIEYTFYIDMRKASSFSEKHGYGKTIFQYLCFKENMEKLKTKVNNIRFNNMKFTATERKKEFNVKLSEVKVFEETYDKVYEIVKEDKVVEDQMKVKKARVVTNKAKFYIDENGKRRELADDVDQVVRI